MFEGTHSSLDVAVRTTFAARQYAGLLRPRIHPVQCPLCRDRRDRQRQLMARCASVNAARARGEATVPSLLGEEKQTNPFLRADLPGVPKAVAWWARTPHWCSPRSAIARTFSGKANRRNHGPILSEAARAFPQGQAPVPLKASGPHGATPVPAGKGCVSANWAGGLRRPVAVHGYPHHRHASSIKRERIE
jgi:hypothetical protein